MADTLVPNPDTPVLGVHKLLVDVAAQFRMYEQSHRAKGTEDGNAKAETNRLFAERVEAFIVNPTVAIIEEAAIRLWDMDRQRSIEEDGEDYDSGPWLAMSREVNGFEDIPKGEYDKPDFDFTLWNTAETMRHWYRLRVATTFGIQAPEFRR